MRGMFKYDFRFPQMEKPIYKGVNNSIRIANSQTDCSQNIKRIYYIICFGMITREQ